MMGILRDEAFEVYFKTTEIYKREIRIRKADILLFSENFGYFNIVTNEALHLWNEAKAQTVPEGFVLVPNENLSTFYQDDSEPENFCTLESDLDILGDGLDCGDIMVINKYNQAEISKEKFYGVWCEIETSYGTAKKFKVFKTEEQAKKSMIKAQEQGHE